MQLVYSNLKFQKLSVSIVLQIYNKSTNKLSCCDLFFQHKKFKKAGDDKIGKTGLFFVPFFTSEFTGIRKSIILQT